MKTVTFKFENKKLMDEFLGWLSDGGGEQEFMNATELELDFEYYRDPVEVVVLEREEEA